jgi:hypothetical protein
MKEEAQQDRLFLAILESHARFILDSAAPRCAKRKSGHKMD